LVSQSQYVYFISIRLYFDVYTQLVGRRHFKHLRNIRYIFFISTLSEFRVMSTQPNLSFSNITQVCEESQWTRTPIHEIPL